MHRDFADKPLEHLPIEQHGILLRRVDGQTYTNVPHLVTHHSPTGYEWGFGGSGPADLALNILEYMLYREHHLGETITCFEGRCFQAAWNMHQYFKRDIIAGCDRDEAHIPLDTVTNWIARYRLTAAPTPWPKPTP